VNTPPPPSGALPKPAGRASFDTNLPDEYLHSLREVADNLSAFLSLPANTAHLDRWATLLSWFTLRLADACPAYLDITSNNADAVERLSDLYRTWAKRHAFTCARVHDDPTRPPHSTFLIQGPFAYAWLCGETGWHRLGQPEVSGEWKRVAVRVWPDVEGLEVPGWDEQQTRTESIPHLDRRGVG
jgi:hypothetical protein